MTHVHGRLRKELTMGFNTVNMDNPKEYNAYKKKKKRERFLKENPNVEKVEPAYEVPEDKAVDETKEITSTDLCGKVIDVDQLRIRNYPEGDVIKTIPKNTEVKIISEFDDIWYKVELSDGTVGFCMKRYLLTYVNGEMYGLNDPRRCKPWPKTL